MSLALGALVRQMQEDLLSLSRTLTDTQALLRDINKRIEELENRPKPGRPRKEPD